MQCTKVCKIQFAVQYAVDNICNNRELVDTINNICNNRELVDTINNNAIIENWLIQLTLVSVSAAGDCSLPTIGGTLPGALRLRAPKQQMLDAAKYK